MTDVCREPGCGASAKPRWDGLCRMHMHAREYRERDANRVQALQKFADAYRAALDTEPHRATTVAAQTLGISRATAIRRLDEARRRGLIRESKHRPQHARWTSGNDGSWLACVECRHPWPCPDAEGSTRH